MIFFSGLYDGNFLTIAEITPGSNSGVINILLKRKLKKLNSMNLNRNFL